MRVSVDLVDKIVAAAEAAIRNEAAVLTGDPRRLAMVNLELESRNGAEVVDYRAWGEWRARSGGGHERQGASPDPQARAAVRGLRPSIPAGVAAGEDVL